eukprot:TRINITY_DN13559_c0_g1_i1.p1 TRINITY_DN13559_c0_g1~~TRINITY_DN13559_c0_g1_i1.p1  ORF type:complete len:311 (+),score=22.60 TRINITY_DN13559_c0_g1_i1:46-978(+)
MPQACKDGAACPRIGDTAHRDRFTHPCRYGLGCRKQHQSLHCSRFVHQKPASSGVEKSYNMCPNLNCDLVDKIHHATWMHECPDGLECRKLIQPEHCKMFRHPCAMASSCSLQSNREHKLCFTHRKKAPPASQPFARPPALASAPPARIPSTLSHVTPSPHSGAPLLMRTSAAATTSAEFHQLQFMVRPLVLKSASRLFAMTSDFNAQTATCVKRLGAMGRVTFVPVFCRSLSTTADRWQEPMYLSALDLRLTAACEVIMCELAIARVGVQGALDVDTIYSGAENALYCTNPCQVFVEYALTVCPSHSLL